MTVRARVFGAAILAAAVLSGAVPAHADKIKHPTVVFAGLDKITGRIITFDVAIDETVQFGTLQITPRVCYTRPPTEAPQTTTFVEVEDMGVDGGAKRIFSGWMFAASPGLHGVEHPIYDIWLNDCRGGKDIIKTPPETAGLRDEAPPPAQTPAQQQRGRQQARPVNPGASPQTGAGPATPPSFDRPIEVGPAPGARGQAQPAPSVLEGGVAPPPQPRQQQQQRAPSPSREPPLMLPPANIPGAR